jgi:plastocyanin
MKRRHFIRGLGLASVTGALGWQSSSPAYDDDGGTITGVVTIERRRVLKGDRSGIIVYLEGAAQKITRPPREPHEIRQIDRKFTPAVSAVVVGTKITFPNDDKIYHNVYSNSEPAKFDLGAYKSGTTESVVVTRPGRVDVFCNIHHEMQATILVLESRLFATTDKAGRFSIRDVPPGSYDLLAWQAHGEPVRRKVTIRPSVTSNVGLRLVEDARRTRHLRKDGTPYGRYD